MTFAELEVGRVYTFRLNGGPLLYGECRADSHNIYKLLRCFDGSHVELCHRVTDITPVPSLEEHRELVCLLQTVADQCDSEFVDPSEMSAEWRAIVEDIRCVLQKIEGQ